EAVASNNCPDVHSRKCYPVLNRALQMTWPAVALLGVGSSLPRAGQLERGRSELFAMVTKRYGAAGLVLLLLAAAPALAESDAPQKKDCAEVAALLKKGADVNAGQADGMTALHWAAYHDDLPTATLLVKAGANARAVNRYGMTPLSLACTNGSTEVVRLLLKAGADPNTALRGGETALMTAARTGKVGPVKLLLGRGARVNARDRKGQTAL